MPPRRLNSVHAAQLFAPGPDGKECEALRYLTETRGLTRPVLRKYGVGRATYSFPDKSGGRLSYVPSECVTFPWIMREAEVAEQEEMRGGRYGGWSKPAGGDGAKGKTAGDGNGNRDEAAPSRRRRGRPRKRSQADEEMENIEKFRADGTPAETPPEKSDEEIQAEVEASMGPFVTRRIKVRSIANKSYQRLDPPGGGQGLFGWHTVPPTATSVVLTEGEFDAMAVCQATGRPAVSLPNGCRSLPVQAVQMLERFDTIVLWMDSDGPGREGAEMFARKLGVERCLVVRPSGKRGRREGEEGAGSGPAAEVPKDANEALLGGWDLDELIEEATNLPHERILRFADVRDQVLHEIVHPDKYRGTPMTSLPGFTSLIKGFRRGELTVLTGENFGPDGSETCAATRESPTGSGKTTFLGQTSLDLVEQGVNVLWGSFEIKNTRLMKKLLQQYMRDVLPMADHGAEMTERQREEAMTSLSALADRFEDLPMYFMKFHGGSDVDDVIDAMECEFSGVGPVCVPGDDVVVSLCFVPFPPCVKQTRRTCTTSST
ncbi:hypothetical protein THAOC_33293 [Thalassiosira oceanica]|uniref:SF4 helicase domain-containing protein n=1 Tax=Thalassiosira oceanica TaxID=159749 RepID=K0R4E5_THAOC|nr:hypothetical protein THAOC_33293 [Thalassiosira oceanica]|eukprot:EJK47953.1 hypothetical protein THAOC_33293 [Thalassiosira oceanica]